MATKRLKELLESRKASRETFGKGFTASGCFFIFAVIVMLYALLLYAGTGIGNGAGIQVPK